MAHWIARENPELSAKQIERFWSKVDKSGDCWVWTGTIVKNGYGRFWVGDTNYAAHRIAYELINHEKPDPELTIDHTCDVRHCVLHLRTATQQENILRGRSFAANNRARDKCIHGHPLSGINLYLTTSGKRECKACGRERNKKHKMKRQREKIEEMMTYR